MAQLVESFGDRQSSEPFTIPFGDLPQRLDRLLLTVPSISELYSRLGDFLLHVVKVDGVWLGSPDEQKKVLCHFSAGEGVERFLSAGAIQIDENSNGPWPAPGARGFLNLLSIGRMIKIICPVHFGGSADFASAGVPPVRSRFPEPAVSATFWFFIASVPGSSAENISGDSSCSCTACSASPWNGYDCWKRS